MKMIEDATLSKGEATWVGRLAQAQAARSQHEGNS
jgi:hypothetical protein